MQVWHFTEMPYPHLPPFDTLSTIRVTLPSKHFDPRIGADLFNRYLDEYMIADDLGFNHMLNEHHQTATCLDVAAPLSAAILARQTRNGRICILGNPVANRGDPVRIAEEMAMIDCISRGRLDVGFVRGVPYEIFAANTNPTQTVERLWEGIDLAVKAWTTHDEPFNFEGRFTRRRAINLWPRPYQSPHPPVWVTGSSDLDSIRKSAGRGYVFATFLQPHEKVRELFDAYRSAYLDQGLPGGGGTAFMPLVYTGETEEDAESGARELIWYMNAKTEPQFRNPPGYVPVELNVQALRGAFSGRSEAMRAHGPGVPARAGRGDVWHARPGRSAGQALLRSGRRLRPSAGDAAGGLPRPQAHGAQHDAVRQGGHAADQGSRAHAAAQCEGRGGVMAAANICAPSS